MKSDAQVLCEAMGIEFHDCRYEQCELATRFTEPAELWELLMYMMQREDWLKFEEFCVDDWYSDISTYQRSFIKWLLSDPARFVRLCAEWRREHPEKGASDG